jgi:hypothetical protein
MKQMGQEKKENGFHDGVRESLREVTFQNAKGLTLTLKKQPRVKDGLENRMARLKTLVAEMEKMEIKPTHRKLASLGFGSKVVNLYFRERKGKEENKEGS